LLAEREGGREKEEGREGQWEEAGGLSLLLNRQKETERRRQQREKKGEREGKRDEREREKV
jgi:hypothetical protein